MLYFYSNLVGTPLSCCLGSLWILGLVSPVSDMILLFTVPPDICKTWFNTEKQNSTPGCRSVWSMGENLAAHFGSEMISRKTDTMPSRTIRSSLAAP